MKSIETSFSFVISKIFLDCFFETAVKALLIVSFVISFFFFQSFDVFSLFISPATFVAGFYFLLVMGLLFYATITPMALVMRLMGKDPLRRRFDPEAKSYWIERRPAGPEPQSMRRQF